MAPPRTSVVLRSALHAVALLLMVARAAPAQQPRADAPDARCEIIARHLDAGDGARSGVPSVVLRATVRARELRFATQPVLDVLAGGCPGLDSVRVIERRNLPDPIVPGVTYRDVSIVVEIFAHLAALCPWRTGSDSARAGADAECLLPSMLDSAAALGPGPPQ